MKIKLNNIDYWINWIYDETEDGMLTTCNITSEGFKLEAVGQALCAPEDRFVKEIGRRISLGRAAERFTESKEVKEIIMKAYFNRPRT